MSNLLVESFVKKYFPDEIFKVSELKKTFLSGRRHFLITTSNKNFFLVSKFSPNDTKSFNTFLQIQSLLVKYHINTPQIIGIDRRKLFLLQEYLGDMTLYKYVTNYQIKQGELIKLYQKSIDVLIQLQSIDYTKIAFDRNFDLDNILREYQIFIKPYLLNRLWRGQISVQQKRNFENFYNELAKTLSSIPKVFCHRDFQSTNLLLDKQHNIFIIDFQGARRALPQYDLASLLEDNYLVLPLKTKDLLFDYYIKQSRGQTGSKINIRNFKRIYNYVVIQRKLHDLAIFIRAYVEQNNEQYLKYIPFNLKTLLRLLEKEEIFMPEVNIDALMN